MTLIDFVFWEFFLFVVLLSYTLPFQLFDMRRWKSAVERVVEGDGEVRCLLPRACVRIALAKEGNDMARTPCWIAIVNLVALDVLIRRLPNALSGQLKIISSHYSF